MKNTTIMLRIAAFAACLFTIIVSDDAALVQSHLSTAMEDISKENTSQPFSCTCDNGIAATGDACTSNGAHLCASCDTENGFMLSGSDCSQNMPCNDVEQGFVNHGDQITGYLKSCPISEPFNQPNNRCTGPKCFVNEDRYVCCRSNNCSCQHGVAATGDGTGAAHCEFDGGHDCESCNDGYRLDGPAGAGEQRCLPNYCTCAHGTATVATGSASTYCSSDGMEDCSACEDGYVLDEAAGAGSQTCLANNCTCPNGNPTLATGSGATLCEVDEGVDCSECHDHFCLEGNAGPGQQLCTPCTCSVPSNLYSAVSAEDLALKFDISACEAELLSGGACQVICKPGYTGTPSTYSCSSGTLTGNLPECTLCKCNEDPGHLIAGPVVSNCTEQMVTGTSCTATCSAGYSGDSQTYTCTADGYTGQPMNCTADPCDASHQPANGNNGTCTDQLAHGSTCQIECDRGYTREGANTECEAGTLQNVSTCEPDSCNAGTKPDNGAVGDCTTNLSSGATCQPICDTGYYPSGPTSCSAGTLDAATCIAKCKCELIWMKQCNENYGRWSEAPQHLDYAGCERFCNQVNLADGVTVQGCELEAVTGEPRTSKGKWCFAHLSDCNYGTDITNNAAAKCVHYSGQ